MTARDGTIVDETVHDEWNNSFKDNDEQRSDNIIERAHDPCPSYWSEGNADDIIPDENVPFLRIKLTLDDDEEDVDALRTSMFLCSAYLILINRSTVLLRLTVQAWVVDIPDLRHTAALLRSVNVAAPRHDICSSSLLDGLSLRDLIRLLFHISSEYAGKVLHRLFY